MTKNRAYRWAAGAAVLALVVTAATIVVAVKRHHGAPSTAPTTPSVPGLPAQLLLSSSMRHQPVPGWKTSSEELGLPPGTVPKVIGNVGNRSVFLGITGTGWWLVGIDVATGRRSFPPVELGRTDDALTFNCFVNGPTMVLCVRQDRDPDKAARAWVVDTEHGAKIFDGPTDLRVPPTEGHPNLEQVGDYVIATVTGEGVHGVGPHAELTWFVPGDGNIGQQAEWDRDAVPQSLAVQGGPGSSTANVVFSVADGVVVKPAVRQGEIFGRAVAYPGGFGYEYSTSATTFSDQVAFFDDSGKLLSRPAFNGALRTGSLDVPMVETNSTDIVSTLDGRKLIELPKAPLMPYARLIGARLFLTSDEKQKTWQQYDLRTGATGNTCDIDSLGYSYIGSDGEVAVLRGETSAARGIDLVTCDEIWSLPGETQSEGKDVWRVNTTLIERINDELFSLVAPP